jgi:outer membrane usher protein
MAPLISASGSAEEPANPYEQMYVAVSVNGKAITQFAAALRSQDGRYLVTSDVLHDARLVPPPAPTLTLNGQAYYAVESLPGARYRFDEDQQMLLVQAIPGDFEATTIDNSIHRHYSPPTPPPFGLFLNHDISFIHTTASQLSGGEFQTVLFNPLGVLTNNMVSTNLLAGQHLLRLDTNFTREMPGHRRMLTVGDTASASTSWAQSVHYAGVQFASNFALQPSFVPFLLPSMHGEAAEPSTVNIYVNNVLSMKEPLDTGPFTVQNIPTLTQQGDIQMVVTDMTGHQQVITRSYITSSQLLRRGVSSYTYEGGIMRWGEGTASDSYHTPFAAGTQRYGIRDNLTVDFRGELLGSSQTVSAGVELGRLRWGVLAGDVAVSHSTAGVGTLAYLLLQRQTRLWSISGTARMAAPSFRQLGLLPGQLAPRLQAQGQLGRSFRRSTSVAVGYLLQECQGTVDCDGPARHMNAATASMGSRLWKWGSLNATATYSPAVQKGTSFALTLTIPMEHRRNLMTTAELSGASQSNLVEFQQSMPSGDGYGYRARYNTDNTDVAGEVDISDHYGSYSLASERSGLGTEYSAEERSSLIFMGKQVMATRWVDNSFALVDVPGQPGIRVYANNQYITRTNGRGLAIVPLAPFDTNVVRLDDKDVPVEMTMDLGEQTLVPYSRTGMMVRFKAQETNGATLILKGADGNFLPVGTVVMVPGATESYEVAYDGEVFIMNLVTPAQLHVQGEKFECDVAVPKAPQGVALPRIGPLVCKNK